VPSRNPTQRLRDILDNIDAARSFIADLSYERFAGDVKTVYAVGRALDIVSEASRRLPDRIRDRHPEIEWRALAGLGNVYRHDYDAVDARMMWLTIHRRLPALEAVIRMELDRLESGPRRSRMEGDA
jgi:uncharacterized protein with HEPN domain